MNYKIAGCDVLFPHQAYGVQLSFMSKVIGALENGQNALLEAPTGSGKTLSLLCSALAWQQREKQRIEEGIAADHAAMADALAATASPASQLHRPSPSGTTTTATPPSTDTTTTFAPAAPSPPPPPDNLNKLPPPTGATPDHPGEGGFLREGSSSPYEAAPPRRRLPKIYYATRTHSQIAQVVKELKRSGYSPRMAVLASKKQYCVNDHARNSRAGVDAACEELLKDQQCSYFKGVAHHLTSDMSWRVHDIEDLAKFGKSRKACPYFLSRRWAEGADLVFGPYSYLVDPVIRRSLNIDVEGSIIIFDEAHNMEDVSREAASLDLQRSTVAEVHGALAKAATFNGKPEVYAPLREAAASLLRWMDEREKHAVELTQRSKGAAGAGGRRFRQPAWEPYEHVWQGPGLTGELAALGLGPEAVEPLWEAYTAARLEEEEMSANKRDGNKENGGGAAAAGAGGSAPHPSAKLPAVRVGALALGTMSRLIQVLRMLHEMSEDGGRDYRLVMQRFHHTSHLNGGGGGRGRIVLDGDDDALGGSSEFIVTFCLWCLNPAVAFRQVAGAAHSIVLTSGTLAPLDSFASELGVPFPVRLEAPHVVDMARQVWAGVIGTGPHGAPLEATYALSSDTLFQDELGAAVLEACRTIPHGVLLFFPSYSLLDRCSARWKVSGTWSRLAQLKQVVTEPKGGGPEALKSVMAEYYDGVAVGRGGLFMAVCRGKVSEGLDFADGNARGVLIVGIPFPAIKDTKVVQKKAFNNAGASSGQGLLPGNTWYEQQAFRALNQAVGRCLRHRADWGAIVLLDRRFQRAGNQKGLSRWVRGALTLQPSFQAANLSMQAFFARLHADPPVPLPAVAAGGAMKAPLPHADPPVDAIARLMAAAGARAPAAAPRAKAAPSVKLETLGTEQMLPAQPWPMEHLTAHQPEPPVVDLTDHRTSRECIDLTDSPVGAASLQQDIKPVGVLLPGGRTPPTAALLPLRASSPPPPHSAAAVATVAAAPGGPAVCAVNAGGTRGRSGSYKGGALEPAAAAQLAAAVRGAPLHRWVSLDVAAWAEVAANRGQPRELARGLAALGLLDAFEMGKEALAAGHPLQAALTAMSPPRGLVAVLGAATDTHLAGPLPPGGAGPADPEAAAFGRERLQGWPTWHLLQALQAAYEEVMPGVVSEQEMRGVQGPHSNDPGPHHQPQQLEQQPVHQQPQHHHIHHPNHHHHQHQPAPLDSGLPPPTAAAAAGAAGKRPLAPSDTGGSDRKRVLGSTRAQEAAAARAKAVAGGGNQQAAMAQARGAAIEQGLASSSDEDFL